MIHIDGRITAQDENEALQKIDHFCWRIQQTVVVNTELNRNISQIARIETETRVDSAHAQHIAYVTMDFYLEFFLSQEEFNPPEEAVPLTQIGIHVDAKNIYDPNGTYPDSLFPQAVKPAPRTSGPDGRDEIAALVDLPQ